MQTAKDLFIENKNQIIDLLNRGKEYFGEVENEDNVKAFSSLIKDVETGEFSIVVVGEFSSGKSTFLNALMGDKFLPSFTSETTATINNLRHIGKSVTGWPGQVKYFDGRPCIDLETIEFEAVEKYLTTSQERSHENVAETIECVDLYLDSKFLEDGVVLVDSPGLNGVADKHRERTIQQINQSHASIFVFSAEQPGRKTDFELIKELKSKVNSIIFVLNKIDCVKASEQSLDSVMDVLKNSYKEVFPEEDTIPKIWPISSYQALVSRASTELEYRDKKTFSVEEKASFLTSSQIENFEERLWRFLTLSEKSKQQLLAPIKKVEMNLTFEDKELKEKLDLLEGKKDADALSEEIYEIENKLKQTKEINLEKTNELEKRLKDIEREIREKAEADFERIKKKQIRIIEDWTELDELDETIEGFSKSMEREKKRLAISCDEVFNEKINDLMMLYYSKFRELLELSVDSSIDLHVDTKLEISNKDIHLGIEEYRTKIEGLEKEILSLQEKIDGAEEDIWEKRKKEEKYKKLEYELRAAKDRKEMYMSNVIVPAVTKREVKVDEYRSRGGILGSLTTLLVGQKLVTTTKLETDTSERDTYLKMLEGKETSYNEEITLLSSEYKELDKTNVDTEKAELLLKKIERKKMEQEEAINTIRQEFKEAYDKKHMQQLKKIKSEIENYIDEFSCEFTKMLRKELKNKRTAVAGCIAEMIGKNLENQFEREQQRLIDLKDQLDASESDKKLKIEELQERREKVHSILNDTITMLCDLEAMETDEIEREAV